MTSPDEPQSTESAPAAPEPPPASQASPTAEQPAAAPPAGPTATQATAGPPPPYAYPAGDPFAPVPRPPKVPWIAPQRKGAAIGISIVAALLLLGGGVGIGAAAFGNDDHNNGPAYRFERPGPGYGKGPFQGYPGMPKGPRNGQQAPASPTPSPSSTS